MGDPLCLKDMGVPPCTGEGGEALGVSSVPGKQLWYGLETSSGGLWRLAVVDCPSVVCSGKQSWKPALVWSGEWLVWALESISGKDLWKSVLVWSGNQLWCFLETISGGLWKMALEITTGGLLENVSGVLWKTALENTSDGPWKTSLLGSGKHLW